MSLPTDTSQAYTIYTRDRLADLAERLAKLASAIKDSTRFRGTRATWSETLRREEVFSAAYDLLRAPHWLTWREIIEGLEKLGISFRRGGRPDTLAAICSARTRERDKQLHPETYGKAWKQIEAISFSSTGREETGDRWRFELPYEAFRVRQMRAGNRPFDKPASTSADIERGDLDALKSELDEIRAERSHAVLRAEVSDKLLEAAIENIARQEHEVDQAAEMARLLLERVSDLREATSGLAKRLQEPASLKEAELLGRALAAEAERDILKIQVSRLEAQVQDLTIQTEMACGVRKILTEDSLRGSISRLLTRTQIGPHGRLEPSGFV